MAVRERTLPDLRLGSSDEASRGKGTRKSRRKNLARRSLMDTLTRTSWPVSPLQRVTSQFSDEKRPNSLPNCHGTGMCRQRPSTGKERCESFEIYDSKHNFLSNTRHKNSDINFPHLVRQLNSSFVFSQKKQQSSSGSSGKVNHNINQSLRFDDSRDFRAVSSNMDLAQSLATLDKASSKSRTEQWIKQLPTERRAYHSPLYRLGNIGREEPPPLTSMYESWIYEEARKSAKGSRR